MFPADSGACAQPRGLGEFPTRSRAVKNGQGAECARRSERSIAGIRQHLNRPIRHAELAAPVDVSPSHIFGESKLAGELTPAGGLAGWFGDNSGTLDSGLQFDDRFNH